MTRCLAESECWRNVSSFGLVIIVYIGHHWGKSEGLGAAILFSPPKRMKIEALGNRCPFCYNPVPTGPREAWTGWIVYRATCIGSASYQHSDGKAIVGSSVDLGLKSCATCLS